MATDKGPKAVGFDIALAHLKKGRKVVKASWGKDFIHLRIDETGLGDNGEFMRMDSASRTHRYPMSTADLLSNDWILL